MSDLPLLPNTTSSPTEVSLSSSRGGNMTRPSQLSGGVVSDSSSTVIPTLSGGGVKRCQALYDCVKDNDDELSFQVGEVIIILNEQTDDDNWMEGMVESEPERRGMFPVSFVHMLQD